MRTYYKQEHGGKGGPFGVPNAGVGKQVSEENKQHCAVDSMKHHVQDAPSPNIATPNFKQPVGNELCELVEAGHMRAGTVEVVGKRLTLQGMQPPCGIYHPAGLGGREVEQCSECQQDTEYPDPG